ncbi:adenylate kinase [Nematocida homosporus]|uniref:adenylate kinase n=1 Tax=Nematocida homosporus TaxID=1912981 RepID=UPI00221F2322|nr:adenylate kinase [Nematocida homosporus]KAI5184302.1 adenylate kinase [Nematocida homosporus]
MGPMTVRILVTGTPAVGKTTLSGYLAQKLDFKIINLSDLIEKKHLYKKRCSTYDTLEYSPQKVKNYLKRKIKDKNNYIIDTHDPETVSFVDFNLIIVLSADLSVLGNRYEARGYNALKTEENLEVEIMEVVYNEVLDHICSSPEEEKKIVRVCTTDGKEPRSIQDICDEIFQTPQWKATISED